jgi:hypothetical protein
MTRVCWGIRTGSNSIAIVEPSPTICEGKERHVWEPADALHNMTSPLPRREAEQQAAGTGELVRRRVKCRSRVAINSRIESGIITGRCVFWSV